MMQWKTLLSSKRVGQLKTNAIDENRSPFHIDYDRIIFSTAFRRLQDKTQVFPLAKSDYVRTRLTHSLEVSCVARSLGRMVGEEILKRHNLDSTVRDDISTILAAAAIAHDIGNPPFGHSGEDAIRNWFKKSETVKAIRHHLSAVEIKDLENYEGNAQGFRLLTVLLMPENKGGMQLTCATLGAFAKYPCGSELIKVNKTIGRRKYNYFNAEKELFAEVAEELELISEDANNTAWCRHPLAFLVEACDDICYRLIDFEDGFKLKLVSYNEVENLFLSIIGDKENLQLKKLNDERSKIEYLRAKAIQSLLVELQETFLAHENEILAGQFTKSLISQSPSAKHLQALKDIAIQKVYCDRSVIEIEAAGFEVADGILETFFFSVVDVMEHTASNASPQSRKLLQLLPSQFKPNVEEGYYTNVLKILDFFSGMTDSYATSLYKKIKGISLPGD